MRVKNRTSTVSSCRQTVKKSLSATLGLTWRRGFPLPVYKDKIVGLQMPFVFATRGKKKLYRVPFHNDTVVARSTERPAAGPELLTCTLQSSDLMRKRAKVIGQFCLKQFRFSTTKGIFIAACICRSHASNQENIHAKQHVVFRK